jgi:topoisomerase-4 subunit A
MGVHLNNIIINDPGDKVIAAFNYDNNLEDTRCLILATKDGMIKRTLVKDLNISKLTKISVCMKLAENDLIVSCCISPHASASDEMLGVVTKNGIGLTYPTNQINVIGKNGAGVKNVSLKENDNVVAIFIDDSKSEFVLLAAIQGMKRIHRNLLSVGNRGNVGKSLISQIKSNPIVVLNAFEINMNEIFNNINSDGVWQLVKASEIVIGDTTTRVSMYKNRDSIFVNKVTPLDDDQNKQQTLFD